MRRQIASGASQEFLGRRHGVEGIDEQLKGLMPSALQI
jgi:hypothetical protein